MARPLPLVALLALLPAGAACSSDPPPGPAPATRTNPNAVHVVGQTFRDGRGRQLLFRGFNAKVDGIFDAKFDDGRAPNEVFYSFDEQSAQRFEDLGVSALRLPVNWSALEPTPGQYSADFFARMDSVMDMAARHHFHVLCDMHQDAYSKEVGEDGAPLWAIEPQPAQLLSGPSDDSRRTSAQVLQAGFSFFDDLPAQDGRSLQTAFIQAVSQIARRYVGNPALLGFEAFNEPVVLSESKLDDFHARFADAIHAIDQDAPVLFEPLATRNANDHALLPDAPWSHGPGVYAPHVYTGWFSVPSQDSWASEDPSVLLPSMQAASQEAAAWGTPLFVTEFGCDQSITRGPKWVAAELDLQDQFLASSTQWIWEENGNWGVRDASQTERPATIAVVARPYPRAVAGDLVSIERPGPDRMIVHYRATPATAGLPHEVSASADYFADYQIFCDGAEVQPQRADGRASFVCPDGSSGEHTFEIRGTLK